MHVPWRVDSRSLARLKTAVPLALKRTPTAAKHVLLRLHLLNPAACEPLPCPRLCTCMCTTSPPIIGAGLLPCLAALAAG